MDVDESSTIQYDRRDDSSDESSDESSEEATYSSYSECESCMNEYDWSQKRSIKEGSSKFLRKLNEFRQCEKYCDLAIRVEDKTFLCHKIILASSTSYFESMLGGGLRESKQDEIILNMVSAECFENILYFMYSRKIKINNKNALDLLVASDFFGLDTAEKLCLRYIAKNYRNFAFEMTVQVFQYALNTGKRSFLCPMSDYLSSKFALFSQSKLFVDMPDIALHLILPCVDYESYGYEVVEAVLRWVNYKLDERKGALHELIEIIEYGRSDAPYLNELKTFATNCNEANLVRSDTVFLTNSNGPPLQVLFTCTLPDFTGIYQIAKWEKYAGILALNHKSEWQCYSRKNTYRYYSDGSKNEFISSNVDDCSLKTTSVNGENCFQLFSDGFDHKHSYRFVGYKSTDVYRPIHLAHPVGNEDIENHTNLCSVKDRVYLGLTDYSNIERNRCYHIRYYESEVNEWFSAPLPATQLLSYHDYYRRKLVSCHNDLYMLECNDPNTEGETTDIWRFDDRMPRWQKLISACIVDPYDVACPHDEKIYIFPEYQRAVQVFDPVANKWAEIAASEMEEDYNCLFAVSYNDLIWTISYDFKVHTYNPKTDTWSNFNSPYAVLGIGEEERKYFKYEIRDLININPSI